MCNGGNSQGKNHDHHDDGHDDGQEDRYSDLNHSGEGQNCLQNMVVHSGFNHELMPSKVVTWFYHVQSELFQSNLYQRATSDSGG